MVVGSESGEVRVNAAGDRLLLSGSKEANPSSSGGDVKINGGPLVKINTVDPEMGRPAPPPELWMEKAPGPVY